MSGALVRRAAMPLAYKLAYRSYRARRYAKYPSVATMQRAAWAAGKITRWARRRYKSRKHPRIRRPRKYIGDSPRKGNCKRFEIQLSANESRATRNLQSEELTEIPFTTTNDIDGRQRELIYISGFKLCIEARNNLSVPMYLNIAVISPKNALNVSTAGFFRGHGLTRVDDFSTTRTSLEFHCLPINADDYNILHHWRFRLNAAGEGATYEEMSGRNYMNFDKWVKLGRQIRYRGVTTESNPVFIVNWCDAFNTGTGGASQAGALTLGKKYITYFRETQS